MRRILSVLFAFVMAVGGAMAQKGSTAFLDEKRGFKGLILGDSIRYYSDMLKPTKGSWYEVTDSTLFKIGDDVKLTDISVDEYNGRIRAIGVTAEKAYGNRIFNIFIEAYGTGFIQRNRYMEKYIWLSDTKEVQLFLNNEGKNCMFLFTDLIVDTEKSNAQRNANSKAVDDL